MKFFLPHLRPPLHVPNRANSLFKIKKKLQVTDTNQWGITLLDFPALSLTCFIFIL